MEFWRKVWREGLAPQLSNQGLQALGQALVRDDPRLLQHFTANLPCVSALGNERIEGACALGYCAWQGDGIKRLGQILAFFARVCYAADEAVGELAASRQFLDWYDRTPRNEMRRELLPEVQRILSCRIGNAA